MQVHITSVPFPFAYSPQDRLLLRHLLQPFDVGIVVVVVLRVVVMRMVVSSILVTELGSCCKEVVVSDGRVVGPDVDSGSSAVVVTSGRVVSFPGSLPRQRLKNNKATSDKGINPLSIV
jgi:hypothetical protein